MQVTVDVDLPAIARNLSGAEQEGLRWAGVTVGMLRSSWGVALSAALRGIYPDDIWHVRVRPRGGSPQLPAMTAEGGRVAFPMLDRMQDIVHSAALAWLAGMGHLSMLRMVDSERARAR